MDTLFSIYKGVTLLIATFKGGNDREYSFSDTKEIISARLKFIGKIKKGEKINVRNSYPYVQQNDLATTFSRTFLSKDNRNNTLSFIRNTIDEVYNRITTYREMKNSSNDLSCKLLISDLKKSKDGISNLKYTYSDDVMFCCSIDTILESIDVKLCNVEE